METKEITLSIPNDVLLKVERLADKQQTSVPGLLTQVLVELVQQEDAYALVQESHLQRLERGADLGTGGQIPIQRDELHERA